MLPSLTPLAMLIVIAATGPCSTQRERPRPNPTSGYAIEIASDGGMFEAVEIGNEGQGCERFAGHEDAERTCLISTNVIPTIIGGEAYGALNNRRTPAFDALVWRARADANAAVCATGGLADAFLSDCEAQAVTPDYEYVVANMRVRVPIGGPSPVRTF